MLFRIITLLRLVVLCSFLLMICRLSIPPNSGSEKEKKTEQYAFLIKKEKSLNQWSGSYFWLREITCERTSLRKFRYDFSRFISGELLFQINGPLYSYEKAITISLRNCRLLSATLKWRIPGRVLPKSTLSCLFLCSCN